MNVLAIGSHPDDIEIGCLGALLQLKKQGHRIFGVLLTNGGNCKYKDENIRMNEQEKCNKRINYENFYKLDYVDGSLKITQKIIDEIVHIIKKEQIDLVFVNYFDDTHQDHQISSRLGEIAAKKCKGLIYYETLSNKNFQPNLYFDVSEFFEEKISIIKLYESQLTKYNVRNLDVIEYLRCKNRVYGMASDCCYSEGFIIDCLKNVQFDLGGVL